MAARESVCGTSVVEVRRGVTSRGGRGRVSPPPAPPTLTGEPGRAGEPYGAGKWKKQPAPLDCAGSGAKRWIGTFGSCCSFHRR